MSLVRWQSVHRVLTTWQGQERLLERTWIRPDKKVRSFVKAGSDRGLRFLIIGGVHGDEALGLQILPMLFESACVGSSMSRVEIIPAAYEAALLLEKRTMPGFRDLNRSFLDEVRDGVDYTLVQQLREIIIACGDVVIDVHSAPPLMTYATHVRVDPTDLEFWRERGLATVCRVVAAEAPAGSVRDFCRRLKRPAIAIEAGSGDLGDRSFAEEVFRIVEAIVGGRSGTDHEASGAGWFVRNEWSRAPRGGAHECFVEPGESVSAGAPISRIWDISQAVGEPSFEEDRVFAQSDVVVIGVCRVPVVCTGDPLFQTLSPMVPSLA